ncbi:hypothetical protein ACLOJK_022371 [Asimina triloba]
MAVIRCIVDGSSSVKSDRWRGTVRCDGRRGAMRQATGGERRHRGSQKSASSSTATHHRRKLRWTIQSIQLDGGDVWNPDLSRPQPIADICVFFGHGSGDPPFSTAAATATSIGHGRSERMYRHPTIFTTTSSEVDPIPDDSNGSICVFFDDGISIVNLPSSGGRHGSRQSNSNDATVVATSGDGPRRTEADERAGGELTVACSDACKWVAMHAKRAAVPRHAHGLLASIEDGWHGRWPTCLRLAG